MHRTASYAIFIHGRGFSTFRCGCVASQRVAGPYGTPAGFNGPVIVAHLVLCMSLGRGPGDGQTSTTNMDRNNTPYAYKTCHGS